MTQSGRGKRPVRRQKDPPDERRPHQKGRRETADTGTKPRRRLARRGSERHGHIHNPKWENTHTRFPGAAHQGRHFFQSEHRKA